MSGQTDAAAKDAGRITEVAGTGIVLRGNEIDTDRIIPARFLKTVTFDGIGEFAFQDVRIDENGAVTDHPFNSPDYQNASVLLVNQNFGCGSSREHAPQALLRWGIKAIIGESFAEIFAGNCNALGVPTVTVTESGMSELMDLVENDCAAVLTVDLVAGSVSTGSARYNCAMPDAYREALIGGIWDSTALLLQNGNAIADAVKNLPYVDGFQ